jgi:hypothetical protein
MDPQLRSSTRPNSKYPQLPKERQRQWEAYLRHGGRARYSYVIDDQITEIVADSVEEVRKIVEENWPGRGGMIIHFAQPPASAVGKVFARIPDSLKEAFAHLSSGYGAICAGYHRKYLVFTHSYVFVSHAADKDSAMREFLDFRQQEEGGIIIPGGGMVRIGQLAAPGIPPMSMPNMPNMPITPNTSNTPNTPLLSPMWGASALSPNPPYRNVRRMMENNDSTGTICLLKSYPTLGVNELRGALCTSKALKDTGCEVTTLYAAENNFVYPSDVLSIGQTFGFDGNNTTVLSVKRYVSLMSDYPVPDVTYFVDVNLPLLSVGLLTSVFKVQTPQDQDTLAYKLAEKASAVFSQEEACNLLDDWRSKGFPNPEPNGKLLALLSLMGLKISFHSPYGAILGYNLWRLWAKDGIEYREEEGGRLTIWGR